LSGIWRVAAAYHPVVNRPLEHSDIDDSTQVVVFAAVGTAK
jgi:hypothetical protein